MTAAWIRRALEAKRDGEALSAATWERLVAGYVDGTVDEAPMAALLMAAAIRGLTNSEVHALTDASIRSGDRLRFTGTVVDKHSTGGVGDSVSLIVVPLVAACGVPVAKVSGRALGHTGGTLDKLAAIPGVHTDLAPDAFRAQVERIGCAIAAQSERLVPADRKLYDLRDRTGSVASIGLIAASIVSKKIAGGAGAIVFDVKCGAGAFMRTLDEARTLAQVMVELAQTFGVRAAALLTAMDEPLGPAVGTALEAIEAREFLAGRGHDARLAGICAAVAAEMLHVAGIEPGPAAAQVRSALARGSAYEKFVELVEAQGGSRAGLESMRLSGHRIPALAARDGTVTAVDAVALGNLARDAVERYGPGAGIVVRGRIGDRLQAGDVLAELVGAGDEIAELAAAFTLEERVIEPRPLVLGRVWDADPPPSSKRLLG